jgi:hypothetical protein
VISASFTGEIMSEMRSIAVLVFGLRDLAALAHTFFNKAGRTPAEGRRAHDDTVLLAYFHRVAFSF